MPLRNQNAVGLTQHLVGIALKFKRMGQQYDIDRIGRHRQGIGIGVERRLQRLAILIGIEQNAIGDAAARHQVVTQQTTGLNDVVAEQRRQNLVQLIALHL